MTFASTMARCEEKGKMDQEVKSATCMKRPEEVKSDGDSNRADGKTGVGGGKINIRRTPPLMEEHDGRSTSWTEEEDEILEGCVKFGMTNWHELSQCIPGKSSDECRSRWKDRLGPLHKQLAATETKQKHEQKGRWLESEDKILIQSQQEHGNKWTRIAELLPGRSENAVKNRWKSAFIQKQIVQKQTGEGINGSIAGNAIKCNSVAASTGAVSSAPVAGKTRPSPSTDESSNNLCAQPALKKQKLDDEGKKEARPRNRPSRSKAAMAERERQRAVEKERDEEAVKSLLGKDIPLSEKEKDLIRRSYAFGYTKGIKGNRKKGNFLKAKPSVQPISQQSLAQRKGGQWSDVIQWEFSNPQESPPPILELEHTLVQHGISLDFLMPAFESDEDPMSNNLRMSPAAYSTF